MGKTEQKDIFAGLADINIPKRILQDNFNKEIVRYGKLKNAPARDKSHRRMYSFNVAIKLLDAYWEKEAEK
jgi:hypothetical protein